jgi:hypothetical protein
MVRKHKLSELRNELNEVSLSRTFFNNVYRLRCLIIPAVESIHSTQTNDIHSRGSPKRKKVAKNRRE